MPRNDAWEDIYEGVRFNHADEPLVAAIESARQRLQHERDGYRGALVGLLPLLGSGQADDVIRNHINQALKTGDATPPAPPAEPPLPPVGDMDGLKWAKSFVAHVNWKPEIATDEGTMVGWFATAIMAGYDEALRRAAHPPALAGEDARLDNGNAFVFCDFIEDGASCVRGAGHNGPHAMARPIRNSRVLAGPVMLRGTTPTPRAK